MPALQRWEWLSEATAWIGSRKPARAFASLAEFAVWTDRARRRGELRPHLERAADRLPRWKWNLLSPDDARMIDALTEYGAWKRDLDPPHDYVHDDGLRLGVWVTAIRRRHYTGRLDPALEHELAMAGHHEWTPFRWDTVGTSWRLGYLALRQYVQREHNTRPPTDHVEMLPDHELNLTRWCVVQRQEYRNGRLAPQRVAALEEIPGWQWEISRRPDIGERPVLDDAEHGQRGAYCRGCRCDPCIDANAAYQRARSRGEIAAELVDARPAREHLRQLIAQGARKKPLARAANINVKAIVNIAEGNVNRIHPERERRVLALTLEQAKAHTGAGVHGELVDAAPSWKLINWMVMRGWPKSWIAREIGQYSGGLQLRDSKVSRRKADAIAELDRKLGRTRRPPRRGSRNGTKAPLPTLDEILAAEREATA